MIKCGKCGKSLEQEIQENGLNFEVSADSVFFCNNCQQKLVNDGKVFYERLLEIKGAIKELNKLKETLHKECSFAGEDVLDVIDYCIDRQLASLRENDK